MKIAPLAELMYSSKRGYNALKSPPQAVPSGYYLSAGNEGEHQHYRQKQQ